MDIELIEYIGQIRNDTPTLGKAYHFSIILDKEESKKYGKENYVFEVMLFMHIDVCFVTLHQDEIDNNIDPNFILDSIINKYGKDKLI